jgi:hypothetical protein
MFAKLPLMKLSMATLMALAATNINMIVRTVYALLALLLLNVQQAWPQTAEETREKLTENQRNIIHLRKEKQQMERQLALALRRQETADSQELRNKIAELKKSIELSEIIIINISSVVSGQRLLLASLESGESPSSLDIALNKALSSNLEELAKDFSNNEEAQREVARLRDLLREESRVGNQAAGNDTLVLATDHQTAEKEFLHLLSLFSNADIEHADSIPDKAIVIRGSKDDALFRENDTLNYLGQSQYHMEFTVYPGDMSVTIEKEQPWRFHIPEKDNGATYIMIYDLTNQLRPRLVMFNKSLVVTD